MVAPATDSVNSRFVEDCLRYLVRKLREHFPQAYFNAGAVDGPCVFSGPVEDSTRAVVRVFPQGTNAPLGNYVVQVRASADWAPPGHEPHPVCASLTEFIFEGAEVCPFFSFLPMWLHARRSNIYLGPVSQMFCDPRPELYELDVYPGVVWGKTAILAWDKNREDILASLAQLHQEGGAA